MSWNEIPLFAVWLTAAILAGGLARTRNRPAWTWFLFTTFTGPIAAYLLVTWPAKAEPQYPHAEARAAGVRGTRVDDIV